MKILVPQSIDFSLVPMEGAEFVIFDPKQDIPSEHRDADVLVIWDMPAALQQKAARQLKNLRCAQALSAGVDSVFSAGFHESVAVCSGRTLHTIPVAEHALFLLLTAARRGHELRDAQHEHVWATHLGGVQPVQPKGDFRTLNQARISIWGFGAIGQHLAKLLETMGAHVTGVATTAGERSGFPVIAYEDIHKLLPTTDALVMILPSTPATAKALDEEKLGQLPAHAWVVNVGRGSTIDEPALLRALDQKTIAGAALDVFNQEPLPKDSPFWDRQNVFVSPHAAGGRPLGAESLIRRQVQHLLADEALENIVTQQKGY